MNKAHRLDGNTAFFSLYLKETAAGKKVRKMPNMMLLLKEVQKKSSIAVQRVSGPSLLERWKELLPQGEMGSTLKNLVQRIVVLIKE